MSDLLASLAARAVGTQAVVRPRINPLFATESPRSLAPPDLWWHDPADESPPAITPPTSDRARVPTAPPDSEDSLAKRERPFSLTAPDPMRSVSRVSNESIDAPSTTSSARGEVAALSEPPTREQTVHGPTMPDRPSPRTFDRFQQAGDPDIAEPDNASLSRPRTPDRASLPSTPRHMSDAEPPRVTDGVPGETSRRDETTPDSIDAVTLDVETSTLVNRQSATRSTDRPDAGQMGTALVPRIAYAESMTPQSLTTTSRRASIEPSSEPAIEQPVRVSIGRLDVRLNQETRSTPPPTPRPTPARQTLSLDDYLRQRNGAGR